MFNGVFPIFRFSCRENIGFCHTIDFLSLQTLHLLYIFFIEFSCKFLFWQMSSAVCRICLIFFFCKVPLVFVLRIWNDTRVVWSQSIYFFSLYGWCVLTDHWYVSCGNTQDLHVYNYLHVWIEQSKYRRVNLFDIPESLHWNICAI